MSDPGDHFDDSCCRRAEADDRGHAAGLLPASVRSGLLSMRILVEAPPREVWAWLTRPELLAQWSPIVPDRVLGSEGVATAQESEGSQALDATVVEVFEPFRLVHRWGPDTLTWQLGPADTGTQLQLVHDLSDRGAFAGIAAGWHLCFGVLHARLSGIDTPRLVGAAAMTAGWDGLRDAYRTAIVPNDADD